MKDWSDLEERYQDMRSEDPASAEDFKKAMTERFQKTVQVLSFFLQELVSDRLGDRLFRNGKIDKRTYFHHQPQ